MLESPLVSDARRAGAPDLEHYFRRRAIGAALVAGGLAVAGLVVLHADACTLFDGLTGEGLPLVVASLACGAAVLVLLVFGAAVLLVLPALGLLFTLTQRGVVTEGSAPQAIGDVSVSRSDR
jgi:cytochrome d ubiquinol oxidase subunit II